MAKDHITLRGGPLDGCSFEAVEWPPRPVLTWEEVEAALHNWKRSTPLRGRYKLLRHSQHPEPYPDDAHIFRGGEYGWEAEPPDGFVDGETQAHLN